MTSHTQMKIYITAILLLSLSMISAVLFAQNNPRNIEVDWKTDKANHLVPLDEFTALMQPDGIPPIDDPKFWQAEKGYAVYFEHEPVIAVEINGEAKAYPLSVLMYHEIVNDVVGDIAFSATYCPLCNSAIVFSRSLEYNGQEYLLDFGVSGMLRNSDLVMWDRQTESWWQQFTGEALVGSLSGAQLTIVPSKLISLREFFENYPEGYVLSTETGQIMEYGSNPYADYDALENNQPRLYKGEVDQRLPAMERVVDVHVKGKYKIYPLTEISKLEVINDTFNGDKVVIFYTSKTVSVLDKSNISQSKEVGSVTVFWPVISDMVLHFKKSGEHFIDEQTGSFWTIAGKCISGHYQGEELFPITHGSHFAFAWFAFHPESVIYGD